MAICEVCFHHCNLKEGMTGACGARTCVDGAVICTNYGRYTALALDPIEKKPLSRFHEGSTILSYGSFGCNLFCQFCQNYDISRSNGDEFTKTITPEKLADLAVEYQDRGNIGVAFTYNEPLISYEFIHDTAKLVKEQGLYNVLVTNGTCELPILEKILPYIDAMNIDLKSMSERTYSGILGGNLNSVTNFIRRSVEECHVELTTLIVPGMNDSEEEMRSIVDFIAGLPDGESIPYHISRFFPRYHMSDREPTDVSLIYKLADIAREKLKYVYTGNC